MSGAFTVRPQKIRTCQL